MNILLSSPIIDDEETAVEQSATNGRKIELCLAGAGTLSESAMAMPVTHYAKSGDVHIAYQVFGDGAALSGLDSGLRVPPRL